MMVSPGLDPGHQVSPARAVHAAAAGGVGEDILLADAVCLQFLELRLQVLGLVVSLADPGVAVGDGDHRHGVVSLCLERSVGHV